MSRLQEHRLTLSQVCLGGERHDATLHCHDHLTRLEPAASGSNTDGHKGPAGGGRGPKCSD